MDSYFKRQIDHYLLEWKNEPDRMPLLVRGARQVGKSSAVRQLGKTFDDFVEINLEKQPSLCNFFTEDIDVRQTCSNLGIAIGKPIVPGKTLLFIDEIQVCQPAIKALRYFKEDYPELHVVAAGSLLEFALGELSTYGVGRIKSIYLYPFSFDEFLMAQGLELQIEYKKDAVLKSNAVMAPLHSSLISQLKSFYLIGGMPAAVRQWIHSRDYAQCRQVHSSILDSYQDDFSKYGKRVPPDLLRQVLRSVALQSGDKFVFSHVSGGWPAIHVKECLNLLSTAGLIFPTKHTDGNGLPLGAEENNKFIKYLFADIGLMQTMLGMPATDILMASDIDFVNKGELSEVFAGLELIKYSNCFVRPSLHYWLNMGRNTNAEVDYLIVIDGKIIPIEVKANIQGKMQSLHVFMEKKQSDYGIRTSLENVSAYESKGRTIKVCPLYALSALCQFLK